MNEQGTWMRHLIMLVCSCVLLAPAQAMQIILSGSSDTPAVRAFSQALAQRRAQDDVRFIPLDQLPPASELPRDTRLILLDAPTLQWRLGAKEGPPTLVLRISRVEARHLLRDGQPAQVTLLWSDPSPARQVRLARQLLPQAQRLGLLFGADSAFLVEEFRQAAQAQGLKLEARRWDEPRDSRPLRRVLSKSDLLLGLDDPKLYNAQTIKSLLLTSYAKNLPVLGPSASFVKAGSLATTYSDQENWLQTLDELLDRPLPSWPLSRYPQHFKVLSNRQVARSLGLDPPNDATLTRQMTEGEAAP
jgi:ABC-type uncharacterized transport system substrate-binding protein